MFLIGISLQAQLHYRLKADFSIKETLSKDEVRLTTGVMSYDLSLNKLIYHVKFPEVTTIVIQDSLMQTLHANGDLSEALNQQDNRFSIFALSLQGQLADFGLKTVGFVLEEVTTEGESVISRWVPPAELEKLMGPIILSHRKKVLEGVVFLEPDGSIRGKQFFRDYQQIDNLSFPMKIIQVSERDGEEYYKVTEFKNVVVNEQGNHEVYDFSIPD